MLSSLKDCPGPPESQSCARELVLGLASGHQSSLLGRPGKPYVFFTQLKTGDLTYLCTLLLRTIFSLVLFNSIYWIAGKELGSGNEKRVKTTIIDLRYSQTRKQPKSRHLEGEFK